MRYLIISQPKAGTYLCSEVFRLMGLTQTFLHLSEKAYTQYDPSNLAEGRANPTKFNRALPLSESLKMVPDQGFAVTHSIYSRQNIRLFKDFRKVLLTRKLDEVTEAFDRWSYVTGRDNKMAMGGSSYKEKFRKIALWDEDPDVFSMNFHAMRCKNIEVLDQLQMHLFGIVKHDSRTIITQALAADTLTKVPR